MKRQSLIRSSFCELCPLKMFCMRGKYGKLDESATHIAPKFNNGMITCPYFVLDKQEVKIQRPDLFINITQP